MGRDLGKAGVNSRELEKMTTDREEIVEWAKKDL